VEAASNMAIRRAKAHKPGLNNLTWGEFVNSFVNNKPLKILMLSIKSFLHGGHGRYHD